MLNSVEYEARLARCLEELGQVGLAADGLCRRPFTDEYEQGVQLVERWMRDNGLEVSRDSIGNVSGRIAGKSKRASVVATGSHLDTVKGGGKYDGMLGVISGILAAGHLLKTYGQPQRTIEIIGFIGEEGSRYSGLMGSKWMAGELGQNELAKTDEAGITLQEAASVYGFFPEPDSNKARQDIGEFIELHIEQGPILEAKGCPLGIVYSITGIRQAQVTVKGRSDHAGTTPLFMRQDALLTATKMISAMDNCVRQSGGNTVFTVGSIAASPGAVNVVAAECSFTVDLRDADQDKLNSLYLEIQEICRVIAYSNNVSVLWKEVLVAEPVPCNPEIREIISEAATDLGVNYLEMISGAGHDAMMIARFTKVGMLFVPSVAGRSHCQEEYTDPKNCLVGTAVLAETIRRLAY